MESRAEAQQAATRARRLSPQEAELSGNSLVNLVVVDEEVGLGGRYLVQLSKRKRADLPWTRLGVGSPVVLSPNTAKPDQSHRGVVYERQQQAICVALDGLPDDLADYEVWRLDLSFDEVAVQRQRAALEQARLARGDRFAILRNVLVGQREPEFGVDPEVRPLDRGLNEVQREAVQFAMSARDIGLIHGPPGTGKTTAVVEVIRQAIRRGKKVLACAPSNLAVDNIFERLLACGERAVRIGHPARVMPELREHTLDLLVEKHQDVKLARKLVKQAMTLFRDAERRTRTAPKPGMRRQLRDDACPPSGNAGRREHFGFRSRALRDDDGPGQPVARHAAIRSGRDRRGVPEHRAGLLDSVAALRSRGVVGRSLPVAADRGERRGRRPGIRRQPV
jgi:hypothetical protein